MELSLLSFKNDIKIQNSFSYSGSELALNSININLEANDSIAVGESGSGKSTLVDMITYKPLVKIFIDGLNGKDFKKDSWRNKLAMFHKKQQFLMTLLAIIFQCGEETLNQIRCFIKILKMLRFKQILLFCKYIFRMALKPGWGQRIIFRRQKQRLFIAREILENQNY